MHLSGGGLPKLGPKEHDLLIDEREKGPLGMKIDYTVRIRVRIRMTPVLILIGPLGMKIDFTVDGAPPTLR